MKSHKNVYYQKKDKYFNTKSQKMFVHRKYDHNAMALKLNVLNLDQLIFRRVSGFLFVWCPVIYPQSCSRQSYPEPISMTEAANLYSFETADQERANQTLLLYPMM